MASNAQPDNSNSSDYTGSITTSPNTTWGRRDVKSNNGDTTGSISTASNPSWNKTDIKSQILPPIASSQQSAPVSSASSYKPSAPLYTPYAEKAESAKQVAAVSSPAKGEVFVESGDTLYAIARRNNVPVGQLMKANNLHDANAVRAGQRLVLPNGHHAVAAAPSQKIQEKTFAAAAPVQRTIRDDIKVTPVARAAEKSEQPVEVASADASAVDPAESPSKDRPVRVIPITKQEAAKKIDEEKPVAVAKAEEPEVKIEKVETTASLPNPDAMTSTEFRWPVQGRIVENFGPQQGGGKNDGINIAVPTGTSVKAAENGVVAYAGSELKGYGKLILIRHDNDYVTAYAHNSDISVKRGDKVTRGQIIGKAGQTGNVTQPQLHFEIRKGSSPIDPLNHLSGG